MRTLYAVLLLLSSLTASAAPTVTSIEPAVGFTFKETLVTIRGTEFSESDFNCEGNNAPFCPASVFFGPSGVQGRVLEATPTTIKVLVPPRPHGEAGPVLVKVVRKGDVVFGSGFRWDQSALSSSPSDYVRYLLPVTSREVPGANGTLWTSEWVVRSLISQPFRGIWPNCAPLANPCFEALVNPGTTAKQGIYPRGDGTDGAFAYLPKEVAVAMSLRVRDLSRNAQSFGTEIPIGTPGDYRSTMHFIDIPTDPKYRATLRIYGPDEAPHKVTMTIYSDATQALIESREVDLQGIVHAVPEPFPLYPSYAQLDPLSPAVRASGERVRIVIHSDMWWSLISPPPPYPVWAFLTITNNDSQQVTTIEPRP